MAYKIKHPDNTSELLTAENKLYGHCITIYCISVECVLNFNLSVCDSIGVNTREIGNLWTVRATLKEQLSLSHVCLPLQKDFAFKGRHITNLHYQAVI